MLYLGSLPFLHHANIPLAWPLKLCLSDFSLCENHLEGLPEHSLWGGGGGSAKLSHPAVKREAREFAFLTSS